MNSAFSVRTGRILAVWALTAAITLAGLTHSHPSFALDSPKPPRPAYELDRFAFLDKALAPLRDYQISDHTLKVVKTSLAALKKGALTRYEKNRESISDPIARKLLLWAKLHGGYGTAEEYRSFLDRNRLWPARELLTRRMEEALFTQGGSAANIKAVFAKRQPISSAGFAALASAELATKNLTTARQLARMVWRHYTLPDSLEQGFLQRFGKLLTESDHKWRFDRIVTSDVRWSANRRVTAANARRVLPLLSDADKKKARARLAVLLKADNAQALMAGIPDDKDDVGLAYHKAQLLRRNGKVSEAAKIIHTIDPDDPEKVPGLDDWWVERRQLAYAMLKNGRPREAYELVRNAGPISVNALKEQHFMAGWIAWRDLNEKARAEQHFLVFAEAADGPLSRAKANYWLGRLAAAQGNQHDAEKYFTEAAKSRDTYHGLLAMQELDPQRTHFEIEPPDQPTDDQIATFNSLDAAKALVIAHKAKLSREYTRAFFISLLDGQPSEAEAGMVAHLAILLDDDQMSLRIGKAAIAKGHNLIMYSYPLHAFPAFDPLSEPPEMPFLLGITRQETEFEPNTVSGAGAKGLMQVMKITAKHVCTDYRIRCHYGRLLKDTSYNAKIAAAYIGDRMREFDNSYILGLAGYNAGPGRARQWIRKLGDPRDPDVDPVDWIESIPIKETRKYVTKVLSNIQVYRARLGNTGNALRLKQDLHRARKTSKHNDG